MTEPMQLRSYFELETENLQLNAEIARLRDRLVDFERLVELLRELLGVQ